MKTLQQDLRRLIAQIGDLPEGFDADAHLYHDLGMGSFKSVELLMALEEKYGVQIPDDRYVGAVSLNQITFLLIELIG